MSWIDVKSMKEYRYGFKETNLSGSGSQVIGDTFSEPWIWWRHFESKNLYTPMGVITQALYAQVVVRYGPNYCLCHRVWFS